MNKLDDYFKEQKIILYLCKKRANIAQQRSKKHLIHLLILVGNREQKKLDNQQLTINIFTVNDSLSAFFRLRYCSTN